MVETSWIGGDLNTLDRNTNTARFRRHEPDNQSDLPVRVAGMPDALIEHARCKARADLTLELGHVRCLVVRNELRAAAANELNQHLTAIIFHCGACLRSVNRHRIQRKKVNASIKSVLRYSLRSIDVIPHLRTRAMKFDFPKVELNINQIIRETVPVIRSEAFDARLNLRLDLESNLPAVVGDRILLRLVIIELVINCIQAPMSVRDRPREILVRSHLSSTGRVGVVVQSNGAFFEPSEMERAFDAPAGSGTGLSICRSILEGHRGGIWTSCNSAHGAAFNLSLPAKREDARAVKQNALRTAECRDE